MNLLNPIRVIVLVCFSVLASLNLLVTLGYIISVIRVWTQFGKGLSDHCEYENKDPSKLYSCCILRPILFSPVYIHGYWFDRILRKPPQEEAYLSSVGERLCLIY